MKKKDHKVSFITLGCRANQYETNAIASKLESAGVKIIPAGQRADICIVNTCTVTSESDRKSRQMIRRAAALSNHVIVTGCFAESDVEAALSIEGVDLVIGNKNKSDVFEAVMKILHHENAVIPEPAVFESCDKISDARANRARAYIKIEDGCDNKCAYCIIPKVRGPVRSKSRELVLSEARHIAESGVREIILTGIEISQYGADFSNGYFLIDLVEEICQIDGISRVSMGSVDPKLLDDLFIKRISDQPKFLKHFHISLQSGCSSTLAAMRRPYNASQALDTVTKLKKAIPDVMISTDIIAGFPGETDENFEETLTMLRRIAPLHIHSFPYSNRPGTEASLMNGQIHEGIKKNRNRALCDLDSEISASLLSDYVTDHSNKPISVLCEKVQNGSAVGHSEHFVEVHFPCELNKIGSIVKVITISAVNEKSPFVNGKMVNS